MKASSSSQQKSRTAKARPVRTYSPIGSSTGEIIEMVPQLLSIRHILVPLDFSETAEKALRYAVSFARQFDAKITLLHVLSNTYFPAGLGEFATVVPVDGPPRVVRQAPCPVLVVREHEQEFA